MPSARLLLFTLAQAALGGFGDILANTLNLMNPPLRAFFNHSIVTHYGPEAAQSFDTIYAISAAFQMVGLLIGFSFMGKLMDYLGRKECAVILRSTVGVLAGMAMVIGQYTNRFEFFVIGHLFAGVVLAFKVLLVIFVAECCPDQNRGMGTMLVNSGASLAVCLVTPLCLPSLFGTERGWTILPLIAMVQAVLHLLTGLAFPQSPKQLYIQHGDRTGAQKSVTYYHGDDVNPNLILREFEAERLQETNGHANLREVLSNKTFRWSLWLVLLLSFVPPVSALNVKSQYLNQLLLSYGLDQSGATLTMLLSSLIALPLLFISPVIIEKFGRRPLFITVCMLCTLEWAGLGLAQFFVDHEVTSFTRAVLGIGGSFLGQSALNLGLLVMAPILLSEICPHNTRAAITQFTQVVPMLLAICQVTIFPMLLSSIGSLFFAFFGVVSAGLTVLVWLQLPETRTLPVDRLVNRVTKARSRTQSNTSAFFHPHYGSTENSSSSDFEDLKKKLVNKDLEQII
ncbi:hypothetical protein PRIPAC_75917 [Pristionchus pacificus]|uniref:Membrane transporter n=1 Tax=Pristionchus pacificus TaxID=54126 RepID=A0A2A6BZK9_PRIPA|nr:hypothetical protein PRIPAC_75917 [Pristionchus pacificus]|eukprot:PDM71286.1 membrane transporter [Pristionchus pacificus]